MTGESGGVSFKVTPEEIEELTEREGIVPTPYMARNMWVTVQQFNKLKTAEWAHYLRRSYELILSKLPKKVQISLEI